MFGGHNPPLIRLTNSGQTDETTRPHSGVESEIDAKSSRSRIQTWKKGPDDRTGDPGAWVRASFSGQPSR